MKMASIHQLPGLTSPLGLVLLGLGFCAVLYAIDVLFLSPPYPKGVALIREGPGARRFSLKTRWAFYTDNVALQKEAWEKFLKKGKPVVIPTIGYSSELIMPPSSIKWIHSMPEHMIGVDEAFVHFDKMYYSLGSDKYVGDAYHAKVVSTFDREAMAAAIWDELPACFEKWVGGVPGEWNEIDVAQTVRMIVAQLTSRFTVGLPLCRNEEYLRLACGIADGLVVTSAVGLAVPPLLLPLAGRIASFPLRSKVERFKKLFEPTYRERLELLTNPASHDADNRPYDHLQITLEFAQRERPDEFTDLDCMARRLCVANFGGIHQSALHLAVIVLDLLGSDAEFNTIATLRDEFKRVINSDGDPNKWTKAKFANLVKADSVGRETMRLHTFGGRTLFRKVIVDGVKTQDGIEIPKGTMFSVLSKMPQTDEATFEDALKYDPFRFSRMRESAAAEGKPAAPVSFVTLSPDHLPFGHGKHACPGRFILEFEMKMLMCYLLSHYDIGWPDEYDGKRPPNVYVTEACFPPSGARMRVRKRETPAV